MVIQETDAKCLKIIVKVILANTASVSHLKKATCVNVPTAGRESTVIKRKKCAISMKIVWLKTLNQLNIHFQIRNVFVNAKTAMKATDVKLILMIA